MSNIDKDILELIERGSLGSPEAKALRATVSDEEARRVIDLANELREKEGVNLQPSFGEIIGKGIDDILSAIEEISNTHIYFSTYCFHKECNDCRLACKICESPCICECHKEAGNDQGNG
jgi:hypothetical protein